jgi:hypothetical protein
MACFFLIVIYPLANRLGCFSIVQAGIFVGKSDLRKTLSGTKSQAYFSYKFKKFDNIAARA